MLIGTKILKVNYQPIKRSFQFNACDNFVYLRPSDIVDLDRKVLLSERLSRKTARRAGPILEKREGYRSGEVEAEGYPSVPIWSNHPWKRHRIVLKCKAELLVIEAKFSMMFRDLLARVEFLFLQSMMREWFIIKVDSTMHSCGVQWMVTLAKASKWCTKG